jgi:hypothetical protein
MIGPIQTGPTRLVIEHIDPNGYGPGRAATTYRVEADVTHHFGLVPKPGAVWTLTKGVAMDNEAELRERVASLYGVGKQTEHLWRFQGKRERWPYQDR